MTIHIDIGGEGRHARAINVNPLRTTTTTGTPGRPIPNLVVGHGERMPFADHVADLVTVENAPLRTDTIDEIARVLKPGGVVRLSHPADYAIRTGTHDAVAGALGVLAERSALFGPAGELTTVLRRAVRILR